MNCPDDKIRWEDLEPRLEEIEIVPEVVEEPVPVPLEILKELLWRPKKDTPKA